MSDSIQNVGKSIIYCFYQDDYKTLGHWVSIVLFHEGNWQVCDAVRIVVSDSRGSEQRKKQLTKGIESLVAYMGKCKKECKACNKGLSQEWRKCHKCRVCKAAIHSVVRKCGAVYDDNHCWCSVHCQQGTYC